MPLDEKGREDGFTLLEVMIALAILAGVVVTVITVMNSHLASSARLSEKATATLVARERLEAARLEGVPTEGAVEIKGQPGYTVSYTTEEAGERLLRICAVVVWGRDEKVEACAFSARR